MYVLSFLLILGQAAPDAADPLMTDLVEALRVAYANGGWLGVLAVVLLFAIRIFRLPFIQGRLPTKGRWAAWPQWLKWAAPVALAFAGGLLLKYLAGMGWGAAAIGALVSAGASILGHKGTKAVGKIEWKHKTGKDPDYVPSKWRDLGGTIVLGRTDYEKRHGPPPAP